jgi:hypothetical protein
MKFSNIIIVIFIKIGNGLEKIDKFVREKLKCKFNISRNNCCDIHEIFVQVNMNNSYKK